VRRSGVPCGVSLTIAPSPRTTQPLPTTATALPATALAPSAAVASSDSNAQDGSGERPVGVPRARRVRRHSGDDRGGGCPQESEPSLR